MQNLLRARRVHLDVTPPISAFFMLISVTNFWTRSYKAQQFQSQPRERSDIPAACRSCARGAPFTGHPERRDPVPEPSHRCSSKARDREFREGSLRSSSREETGNLSASVETRPKETESSPGVPEEGSPSPSPGGERGAAADPGQGRGEEALTCLLAAVELRVLGAGDVPAGRAGSPHGTQPHGHPPAPPGRPPPRRPAHILSFWCCRFPMAAARPRPPPAPARLRPRSFSGAGAAPKGPAGKRGRRAAFRGRPSGGGGAGEPRGAAEGSRGAAAGPAGAPQLRGAAPPARQRRASGTAEGVRG